nr:carboxymuconolactone decarboxylase family protein [Allobaculum mucilyticum]
MAKIVQTAGRNALGTFAPDFARYNDDILFGEVWNDETLSPKTRSMIVLSIFMGRGLADSSLDAHLQMAKKHGMTKSEFVALVTQGGFYAAGQWPGHCSTAAKPSGLKMTKILKLLNRNLQIPTKHWLTTQRPFSSRSARPMTPMRSTSPAVPGLLRSAVLRLRSQT